VPLCVHTHTQTSISCKTRPEVVRRIRHAVTHGNGIGTAIVPCQDHRGLCKMPVACLGYSGYARDHPNPVCQEPSSAPRGLKRIVIDRYSRMSAHACLVYLTASSLRPGLRSALFRRCAPLDSTGTCLDNLSINAPRIPNQAGSPFCRKSSLCLKRPPFKTRKRGR
jgi:hypothetical protein